MLLLLPKNDTLSNLNFVFFLYATNDIEKNFTALRTTLLHCLSKRANLNFKSSSLSVLSHSQFFLPLLLMMMLMLISISSRSLSPIVFTYNRCWFDAMMKFQISIFLICESKKHCNSNTKLSAEY